jgi:catechol 2,3-dioxygenase-like lactoylglutathione lyase family enzyme
MIQGGNATIFVSLGLRLQYRAGDHWAQVEAGDGLCIGLHPADEHGRPGSGAATQVGFNVTEPVEVEVKTLESRGVRFKGPVHNDGPIKLAFFADPDGNDLYLCGRR